jgi:hypothetical protein
VSTVSAAAALGSLVNLDALDNKGTGVETLGVGVGLSVLEEVDQELGRLDRPAGLGDTELLACRRKSLVGLFHSRQISHYEFFRAATVSDFPPGSSTYSVENSHTSDLCSHLFVMLVMHSIPMPISALILPLDTVATRIHPARRKMTKFRG